MARSAIAQSKAIVNSSSGVRRHRVRAVRPTVLRHDQTRDGGGSHQHDERERVAEVYRGQFGCLAARRREIAAAQRIAQPASRALFDPALCEQMFV